MIAYHLCWDLSYFRFIAADVGYDPAMGGDRPQILSVFLFLVGVGLVLGHGRGIRWRASGDAGSAWLAVRSRLRSPPGSPFPDSFVYFGVLHAIALFSLLALPFLTAPLWLPVVVAVVVIGLPFPLCRCAVQREAVVLARLLAGAAAGQ